MKTKAFTLVELLVVIAILGILSTISIIGYSNLKDKANYSNDTSLVSQWNLLLASEDAYAQPGVSGTPSNVNEVKELLIENNSSNNSFIPKTNGYHFYWCKDTNNIYLVDDSSSFSVDFPTTDASISKNNSYRLDLIYSSFNCSIPGVNLDRNAGVVNENNVVTFAGTVPASIKINNVIYKVIDNKVTIKPTTSDTINIESDPTIYVSTISFDGITSSVNVTYNQNQQLNIVFDPSNPTTTTVEWSSSDDTVATVSASGLVTAHKVGTCIVSAKSTDLFGVSGSCTINVIPESIQKPTNSSSYIYNGAEQTFILQTNSNYTISNDKRTNAGSQKVTVVLNDKINYQWNDNTNTDLEFDFIIAKASQTISAPTAEETNIKSNTVTLTAVSAGYGDTKYGYSTTNNSSAVTNWQASEIFASLSAETTYYFFAKYEGNENYNAVISSSKEIVTPASGFTITANLTNVSGDSSNPTLFMATDNTLTLVYTSTTGFLLPTSTQYTSVISVSNATIDSWVLSNEGCTGTLVISNASANITITIIGGNLPTITSQPVSGEADIHEPHINLSVVADGTNLSYQWQYKNPSWVNWSWKTIEDGQSSTCYCTGNVGKTYFRCIVTNPYGSVTSNEAYLDVIDD